MPAQTAHETCVTGLNGEVPSLRESSAAAQTAEESRSTTFNPATQVSCAICAAAEEFRSTSTITTIIMNGYTIVLFII